MLTGTRTELTRTEVFHDGDVLVGEIRLAKDWEAGEIEVGEHTYRAYRRGRRRLVSPATAYNGGPFILELDGEQKAQAEVTRRAVRPERTITCDGRTYILRALSAEYVLEENGQATGRIFGRWILAPKPPARLSVRILQWFGPSRNTRERVVDFPADVPLPTQLFIVWLVKILERRNASLGPVPGPSGTNMLWAAALGRRKP